MNRMKPRCRHFVASNSEAGPKQFVPARLPRLRIRNCLSRHAGWALSDAAENCFAWFPRFLPGLRIVGSPAGRPRQPPTGRFRTSQVTAGGAKNLGRHSVCRNSSRKSSSNWHDARIKLYLIWKALAFRRDNAALFYDGDFIALPINARRAENAAAFARRHGGAWMIAVVPRWLNRAGTQNFSAGDAKFWANTEISIPAGSPGQWHNILTGETLIATNDKRKRVLRAAEIFRSFPVALLSSYPRIPIGKRRKSIRKR